jgi:hypothetical protein
MCAANSYTVKPTSQKETTTAPEILKITVQYITRDRQAWSAVNYLREATSKTK